MYKKFLFFSVIMLVFVFLVYVDDYVLFDEVVVFIICLNI